jgi:hypothetical protein
MAEERAGGEEGEDTLTDVAAGFLLAAALEAAAAYLP